MHALRSYWEYKKTVFLTAVIGIALLILVIAGVAWYVFVGAPAWNTFAENFVGFFTNWGNNITLAAADLQTYLLEHWVDLILLLLFFVGLGGFLYSLVGIRKRKHRVYGAIACIAVMAVSGLATIGNMAVNGQLQINPNTGNITAPTLTHYYVLYQFRGVWRDGWWWNEAALDTTSCTITRQSTTGEISQLRWQITYNDWTTNQQEPVALAKVYIKITYTNGDTTGWLEIFSGGYANGNFNFDLRVDCPNGLTPQRAEIKITELDYTWLIHHGYVQVFYKSQSF